MIELVRSFKLDDAQRDVVESYAKDIIVVAGSGSGKTRVLVERIKNLVINRGVRPVDIVAITFTNMAAEEMKMRLSNIPNVGDMFIGTIHSFAHRIYKNSGREFAILSGKKVIDMMKKLIDRYALSVTFDTYLAYLSVRKKVSSGTLDGSAFSEHFSPAELYEINVLSNQSSVPSADADYPENIFTLCKKENIITFDELLAYSSEYFAETGSRVEYLFVDELQDIGYFEFDFLKSLEACNSFLVGDDFQSIYSFKGGDVEIFKSLIHHEDYEVHYLVNNYRSSQCILDLADIVISQVPDRIEKYVICYSDVEGSVTIDSMYNLGSHLERLRESGNYKDWFVLVRTNKDIHTILNALKDYKIPCTTFKKSNLNSQDLNDLYESNEVKVLTVHTSKGLESKNVILYGKFPIEEKSYLKQPEERRVMYVGMTRAKENLVILN